ncbi:MAG: hypothetical protein JST19_11680 [Bacteroidetes bacterium]|nr:hypothetical protein [Bacteroidota bacterium]
MNQNFSFSKFKLTKKLIVVAMVSLPLVSCLSKEDPGPETSGSWTFDGTKYTPDLVQRTAYALVATHGSSFDVDHAQVTFVFKTLPTSSGVYKMVGFNVNGGQPANDNEVTVGALGNVHGGPFYSSTFANESANVTVTNGKIHVTVPEVWASNIDKTDSVKISANIIEQ